MDLNQIRREYLLGGLRRENLLQNPTRQFELWLEQAIKSEIPDPTAMVLATVDEQARPHQRIVLLKEISDEGFVFFTNYASAKAQQIAQNSAVSLLFPWHPMERQVRVAGVAHKISAKDSLKYFLTRPKESQLAAWASKQSQRISSRSFLVNQFEQMKTRFASGQVPLPDFWGGFSVTPEHFEFWQGGSNRLHDRFEYVHHEGSWTINRLAP